MRKIVVPILFCAVLLLQSCAGIIYGRSSVVTIESDKEADTVDITAIGPREVVHLSGVSMPYRMKVKHKNLPLRVSLESDKNLYDPFTIGAVRKGETLGTLSRVFGYSTLGACTAVGTAFAVSEGTTDYAGPAFAAGAVLGGGLLAIGYTAETDVPDRKFYLTSSRAITEANRFETEKCWQRIRDEVDIYQLLEDNEYKLSKAKVQWLIRQVGPSGELYYLKGISDYYLGNHDDALHSLSKALFYSDVKNDSEFTEDVYQAMADVKNAKQLKIERRKQLWADIANATLEMASSTYQTYNQIQQQDRFSRAGMSPSGVVTDPSKLSAAQLNRLIDPSYAIQQTQQQSWAEYQLFCAYNKKADGSDYSYDEWFAMKGQALLDLKEQGVDLVGEMQEQSRQQRREREEERRQDKQTWFARYGYDTGGSAAASGEPAKESSVRTDASNSGSAGSAAVDSVAQADESSDADMKEQFMREPVSGDDYHKLGTVTLYYRDGDKAKVKMERVELYRKGAYQYIKIGSTFYPRRSPDWQRFRHAIAYGHTQLYYND